MSATRRTMPDGILAQHGLLREMVSGVRAAHAAGVGWEALAEKVDEVLEVVREHFEHEEREMKRAAYPRLDEHALAHQTFLRRLVVVRAECERRETELMALFTELLENWFKNHERTADRHVLEYLGLASPPK